MGLSDKRVMVMSGAEINVLLPRQSSIAEYIENNVFLFMGVRIKVDAENSKSSVNFLRPIPLVYLL